MVMIRHELSSDVTAREGLLDVVFGAMRRTKTCERLREGRLPAAGLSFVATWRDRLIGTIRLWHVSAGRGRPALMLGPLAVDPEHHSDGVGSSLMAEALAAARRSGVGEIFLLGDELYYARFGFSAKYAQGLSLPGPYEQRRLLGLPLVSLADVATGVLCAAGLLRYRDKAIKKRPCPRRVGELR
jgi:predicted N-acetyltransferase YhbS